MNVGKNILPMQTSVHAEQELGQHCNTSSSNTHQLIIGLGVVVSSSRPVEFNEPFYGSNFAVFQCNDIFVQPSHKRRIVVRHNIRRYGVLFSSGLLPPIVFVNAWLENAVYVWLERNDG